MTGFNSKREAAADKLQEPVVDKGFPWTQKHVATPQVFGAMPSNIPPPQPAQEPIAWMYQCTADNLGSVLLQHRTNLAESGSGLWIETPLYTAPPQRTWVGLTEDEIKTIVANYCLTINNWSLNGLSVAQAVAAKLKEKNT